MSRKKWQKWWRKRGNDGGSNCQGILVPRENILGSQPRTDYPYLCH